MNTILLINVWIEAGSYIENEIQKFHELPSKNTIPSIFMKWKSIKLKQSIRN